MPRRRRVRSSPSAMTIASALNATGDPAMKLGEASARQTGGAQRQMSATAQLLGS